MKVIKATGDIANDDLCALYDRWMSLPREGRVLPDPEQVTGAFLGEICG